jgi:hypothetical protein
METRLFKSIETKISAEVAIASKYYEGSIETLSEEGLFEIVFVEVEVSDFNPDNILVVKFNKPSGEKFNFQCKTVWLRLNRNNSASINYCMGMEIISPPESYKKFLKTLEYVYSR